MADVLDIDNAEEFEVDEDGDRKLIILYLRYFSILNHLDYLQKALCV